MSINEGYLQIKLRELNERIKSFEEKEKTLSLKLKRNEENVNKIISIEKKWDEINQIRNKLKELPEEILEKCRLC
ncbi:MAG TPA: hypothetical protein VKP59_01425, partial [Candidatus Thermoplasmatota archaeon]|nr:hypothetical protein [Candidatus Thermoplasmatota archaeon]